MPKVQSPKSESGETPGRSVISQVETADVGPWTLDFGLRVADLRKTFVAPNGATVDVLRGASFSVSAGEVVALVGASGAGKSTLLHLLGGLDTADHGSITAGGFSLDRAGANALAGFRNRHVGFVFQFHHLLPDLTAAENVSLPLRILRIKPQDAMGRARQMLQKTGLDGRTVETVVGRLSGGEQQRVAVCRALIGQPEIVLADEPTGNLDTTAGDDIARSLISYASSNRALVIIATHNAALAAICDRTLVLSDGRLN